MTYSQFATMFKFLQGLDNDIQHALLAQLRDLWTHNSTALEGNTLTLGDTHFLLEEGLTVSGKPLKDHNEVIGHARALELVYTMLGRNIDEEDIFALHKAIQSEQVVDIYKPNGAWKMEPNGTYVVDDKGRQIYIEYADPKDVPKLMIELIHSINAYSNRDISLDHAPSIYAKLHMGLVHIHPFWDGNGRIARLLSNLPLLNSGLPPIVIEKENRRRYISVLSSYQQKIGQLSIATGVWPDKELLTPFVDFCREAYRSSQQLVEKAFERQALRAGNK